MACLLKRLVDFLGPGPSIERAGLDETVVFLRVLGDGGCAFKLVLKGIFLPL